MFGRWLVWVVLIWVWVWCRCVLVVFRFGLCCRFLVIRVLSWGLFSVCY